MKKIFDLEQSISSLRLSITKESLLSNLESRELNPPDEQIKEIKSTVDKKTNDHLKISSVTNDQLQSCAIDSKKSNESLINDIKTWIQEQIIVNPTAQQLEEQQQDNGNKYVGCYQSHAFKHYMMWCRKKCIPSALRSEWIHALELCGFRIMDQI